MFVRKLSGREQYYLVGYFEGNCCFQIQDRRVCQTSNEQEVNSKPLASCSLLGMFFTESVRHIQEDGYSCKYLSSNVPIVSPWKKKINPTAAQAT